LNDVLVAIIGNNKAQYIAHHPQLPPEPSDSHRWDNNDHDGVGNAECESTNCLKKWGNSDHDSVADGECDPANCLKPMKD